MTSGPEESGITASHIKELATALLFGALWKLAFLALGPGEPFATGGAILIAVGAILGIECLARWLPSNRRTPPLWGVIAMGGLSAACMVGSGFGIGTGILSCWVLIILSSWALVAGSLTKNGQP